MCKVLAFTNMRALDVKKTANELGPELLRLERDGFGYAVQGKSGQFGEKFVGNYFKSRFRRGNEVKLPITKKSHCFIGEYSSPTGPGIFHGRTSTNVKGLTNAHPMVRDGWTLIHNGVVTNQGETYKKLTDNDSEDVLYHLIKGIKSVEANLTGYYAFAAIDPTGQLHVCKDSTAQLHVAYSKVKDTYVFGTTPSLIEYASKQLQLKVGPIDEVEDNVYMVFKGNEVVLRQTINPRGWTSTESAYSKSSLGYSIGNEYEGYPTGYSGYSSYSKPSKRHNRHGYYSTKKKTEYSSVTTLTSDAADTIETTVKPTNSRDFKLCDVSGTNPLDNGVETLDATDEDAYYVWRHEVDNMDASYSVETEDGTPLTIEEFRRLDFQTQERCVVTRPDGTLLLLERVS